MVFLLSRLHCRALGDPDYKSSGCKVVCGKPDVSRTQLRPGDSAVLIASDGAWELSPSKDVLQLSV